VKTAELDKAAALLKQDRNKLLSLEDGQQRYVDRVSRAVVVGRGCRV